MRRLFPHAAGTTGRGRFKKACAQDRARISEYPYPLKIVAGTLPWQAANKVKATLQCIEDPEIVEERRLAEEARPPVPARPFVSLCPSTSTRTSTSTSTSTSTTRLSTALFLWM